MGEISEGIGLMLGLLGLMSMAAAAYAWWLVPRETLARLRQELEDQRKRIADRDIELAEFRRLRVGDVHRLEHEEERLKQLDLELTDLRAWRYGAERYMRALEVELKRSGGAPPDRARFGIDGEEGG